MVEWEIWEPVALETVDVEALVQCLAESLEPALQVGRARVINVLANSLQVPKQLSLPTFEVAIHILEIERYRLAQGFVGWWALERATTLVELVMLFKVATASGRVQDAIIHRLASHFPKK